MRVLVTGATGAVGGRLAPALRDAGHDVRVLVRDPGRYEPPDGVEVIAGDLLRDRPDDALAGVDAAYFLVHSLRAGPKHAERDRRAAHNFAAAASEATVDRVVYLGALGDAADAPSPELRARREVEAALADGDYDLTTLRASMVVGPESVTYEMLHALAGQSRLLVSPRWMRSPCQPVAVADAVASLAGVLEAPETAGERYEIGGPDVLTFEEAVRTAARIRDGRTPEVVRLPVLAPRLSTYWVALLAAVPTSVARRLVLGLQTPSVAADDAAPGGVDVAPTPFEDAVRDALE